MPIDPETLTYSSSLTIEETAPAEPGGSPRTIVLTGASLPFMGAEWAFENQIVTTWYPGNPVEATQQNLGPREMPSTWQGDWRRTMLSRTPAQFIDKHGVLHSVRDPYVLRDALEEVGRSGIRLRVTWSVSAKTAIGRVLGIGGVVSDDAPKIVREGLIKSARFPHTRHTDIQWTVEFHWASRGGVADRVVSTRQDDDLLQAGNSMSASAAATLGAIDQIKALGTNFTLGKLEQLLGAPFRAVNAYALQLEQGVSRIRELGMIATRVTKPPDLSGLGRAVNSISRGVSQTNRAFGGGSGRKQPRDVTQAMSNEARALLAASVAHQNAAGRLPAEVSTTRQSAAAVLRSTVYFATVSDRAILDARSAYALVQRLRQPTFQRGNAGVISVKESQTTRAGDVLAVHVVKTGDTPQRLSVRYYKSPDHAADILSANKLPLHQAMLTIGTAIIIPVLSNRPRVAS